MNDFYLTVLPLVVGFLLDCLIGDPFWLPHPIRGFGWIITHLEKRFNTGNYRRLKGVLITTFLVGTTWIVLYFLFESLNPFSIIFIVLASIGVFYGLANRSLIYESWLVIKALNEDTLDDARTQLGFIVGRETKDLDEQQIRTAVLETMAENLSDGVIAPLIFYAIGGVPLLFAYKMSSTLDSMIGYKSERFREFGWFAARLDDLFNLIPARLTALLMVLVSFSWNGASHVFRFGHRHSSPNAGYPEAALSGILKCRFGGPNVYGGKLVDKPYIGDQQKVLTNRDFYLVSGINLSVSLFMLILILIGKKLGM